MKSKTMIIIIFFLMSISLTGCFRQDYPLVPNDSMENTSIQGDDQDTAADTESDKEPVETEVVLNDTVILDSTPATNITPRNITGFRLGEMPPGQVFFFLGTGAGCMSEDRAEQDFGYLGDSYYRFMSMKYPCTSGAYMKFTKITTESNSASFVKEWIRTNYPGAYITSEGGDMERIIEARSDNASARIIYQDAKSGNLILILERVHAYPLATPKEDFTDMDRIAGLYEDTYMVYSEALDARYYSSEGFILEDGFLFGIGDSCSSRQLQESSLGLEGTNAVTYVMNQLFYTCDSGNQRVFSIIRPSNDDMILSTKNYLYPTKDASVSLEDIDGQSVLKKSTSKYVQWVWHDSQRLYSWGVSGSMDEVSQAEYDEVMMMLQEYVRNHPSSVSGSDEYEI